MPARSIAPKPGHLATALAAALVAAGCTFIAPGIRVTERHGRSDGAEAAGNPDAFQPTVREITPELIAQHRRQRNHRLNPHRNPPRAALGDGYIYRIGTGDVVRVIVWNHPELSNPVGTTTGSEGLGRVVREDGAFFFPFAGTIHAAGRTVEEVRRDITGRLGPYIEDPQVEVQVMSFRSQKVFVTGEVNSPGAIYLNDRPLTVLDALGQAGIRESADYRFARLYRDGENRTIDLLTLYATGSDDEVLRDGDVLHLPADTFNQVFVMGEVGSQTIVPLRRGRLTLAEALAASGGVRMGTADTRRIVVIRGDPVFDDEGELEGVRPLIYQLDGRTASALILAEGFELEPRDIVFIPAGGFVRWSRVIEQILPTVQTLWMTDRIIRG